MRTLEHLYEPHLAVRKYDLRPGEEWQPSSAGWWFIQIASGIGYWMGTQMTGTQLEVGMVLVVAGTIKGRIRASQLGGLALYAFNIIPTRLASLFTETEQKLLLAAEARTDLAFQVVPSAQPLAARMKDLCSGQKSEGLVFKLQLLEFLTRVLGDELSRSAPDHENPNAKERLRLFLEKAPLDELLEMSLGDLARLTNCTPRHVSRICHEVMGKSFRERRAEIRLTRAIQLLASRKSKLIDVAFDSGFRSLSLFNLEFKRRFGTSPGKWRKQLAARRKKAGSQHRISRRLTNDSCKIGYVSAALQPEPQLQPVMLTIS